MTGSANRNSVPAHRAWNKDLSRAIDHACERAIARLFSDTRDERIKQALAQGFLAGVGWCFSEQSDEDIAKSALALGLEAIEAATGVLRRPVEAEEN
jgi:hypothetical protein